MQNTHISLDDQAQALRSLPAPPCQDIVRKSAVLGSRDMAPSDANMRGEERVEEDENPGQGRGYVVDCHPLSSDDQQDQKWRRRESNPRPVDAPRQLLRV